MCRDNMLENLNNKQEKKEELLGYFVGISESVSIKRINKGCFHQFLEVSTCLEGQGGATQYKYVGKDPSEANKIFKKHFLRIYKEMMNKGKQGTIQQS